MFPGTTDVRGHYSATRVFALSSIREGQPNVLIEAMACGLPVCATNVGGIPRLVNDGVNGYLCNPRDPAAMAGRRLTLWAPSTVRGPWKGIPSVPWSGRMKASSSSSPRNGGLPHPDAGKECASCAVLSPVLPFFCF